MADDLFKVLTVDTGTNDIVTVTATESNGNSTDTTEIAWVLVLTDSADILTFLSTGSGITRTGTGSGRDTEFQTFQIHPDFYELCSRKNCVGRLLT